MKPILKILTFVAMMAPGATPLLGANLDMREVADGVWVHIGAIALPDERNAGDISNFGFIIGEKSVLVVDAGGSDVIGRAILDAVAEHSQKPVSHLVITHVHPDHIYGAKAITDAGAALIGHQKLNDAIAARKDSYAQNYALSLGASGDAGADIPAVEQVVETTLDIDLGGRVVTLRAHPLAHTDSDVTILDQKTGVIFLGDLLFDDHVPVIDGSLRGWQGVMNAIDLEGAKIFVPGHGAIFEGEIMPEDVWRAQREYFDVLATDAKAEIEAGAFMSDAIKTIGRSEAENWSLFDEYNARNASVVFTELEWE